MNKIDFAMTEDGDLILGPPKVNDDNEILYLHKNGLVNTDQYHESVEGKEIRDMSYVLNKDAYKQIIYNRLRTDAPDWFHHPKMGGNLTDLIGEPNTQATGVAGANRIYNALTYGNLFSPSQVTVKPIPISAEDIVFVITVQLDNDGPFRLPVTFNLNSGLKEV